MASAEDLMIRSCLCTTRPDATIRDAAEKMCQQGSTALVVFDGVPVGLLTEDHMIHALATLDNPGSARVREFMSPSPIPAVSVHSVVSEALAIMSDRQVSAVAVRDGHTLVGLLTLRQILPVHGLGVENIRTAAPV